ncbi:MAG: Gx transporter family protein [Lachnospiraceae bacterium]|nr:Gx transporter family protein [Lachnospiraceae bacterium]
MKPKQIVAEALLCCLALVLSYVESLFPLHLAVPGIKMGLPNLVIVFALYRLGAGSALRISLVRVGLSALLFGNVFSLLYSAAGAVLSLSLMAILARRSGLHTAGVSVSGAVCHNLAQIGVAMMVLGTREIIFYLPVLLVSGTVSGVVIGVLAALMISRIPHEVTDPGKTDGSGKN